MCFVVIWPVLGIGVYPATPWQFVFSTFSNGYLSDPNVNAIQSGKTKTSLRNISFIQTSLNISFIQPNAIMSSNPIAS